MKMAVERRGQNAIATLDDHHALAVRVGTAWPGLHPHGSARSRSVPGVGQFRVPDQRWGHLRGRSAGPDQDGLLARRGQGVGRPDLRRCGHMDHCPRRAAAFRGQPRPPCQPQGEGADLAAQGASLPSTRSGCRGSTPWCSCPPTTSSATSPARPAIGSASKTRKAAWGHDSAGGILAALINRDWVRHRPRASYHHRHQGRQGACPEQWSRPASAPRSGLGGSAITSWAT